MLLFLSAGMFYKDSTTKEINTSLKKKRWSVTWESNKKDIDFKDVKFLSRFTTERGRILPRRITGLSAKQQKIITKAIKRARAMSLLPYISYSSQNY